MASAISPKQFMRRPFDVEAVQVTAENFEAVAKWCGGKIVTIKETDDNDVDTPEQRHISVDVARPLGRRQTEAYEGDWILYASKGFKVYANRPFQKNFVEKVANSDTPIVSQEAFDKLRYELKLANDIAHDRQLTIERLTRDAPQELMVTDEPAVVTVQDSDEAVNVS